MTIGTHGIPVLVTPCPVQRIPWGEALSGVERKPALSAGTGRTRVPGDGQGLQAATRKGHQILLQGTVAKGVENTEVSRFAIFALCMHVVLAVTPEESRLNARLAETRIGKITKHAGRIGLAHRPVMIRTLPVLGLPSMATQTTGLGRIAGRI